MSTISVKLFFKSFNIFNSFSWWYINLPIVNLVISKHLGNSKNKRIISLKLNNMAYIMINIKPLKLKVNINKEIIKPISKPL